MPLLVNRELTALMEQFHVLTGLRMVLFDENYQELLAYPMEGTPFCVHMRQTPAFDALCRKSDRISFERCRKTNELTVYKCHAGLIEVIAPLTAGGKLIGYVMFGQITDIKDKDALIASLRAATAAYGEDVPSDEEICRIKYKNTKQIPAAAKILEACAGYILLKDMIRPTDQRFFERVEEYVRAHLSEELSVERLCRAFHISRTNLYTAMRPHVEGGIAAYIRRVRLSEAEKLLKTTDLPIDAIAARVGFEDYTYFLRVFKQAYGRSPRALRSSLA
ncbi:MAG: PocR ligand-binding domain-containing protein [Clostridia bacterium]|nr:PocR ligand-binding domain-containing protein [Clostridia bacterium]